jgi:hypothetical protein
LASVADSVLRAFLIACITDGSGPAHWRAPTSHASGSILFGIAPWP